MRKYESTGARVGTWELTTDISGNDASGWTNPTGISAPTGVAVDGSGNVYVTSNGQGTVKEYDGTSGSAISYSSPTLSGPMGLAIDGTSLFVAQGNSSIGKFVLSTGSAAGGWTAPSGIC